MFYRLFIFCCFNLFLVESIYGQGVNEVVVVTHHDHHDDLGSICASYDESLKEFKLSSISSHTYGIVFTISKPEPSEIDAKWVFPIQLEDNVIIDYQEIEIILNFETDIDLPNDVYDVHVIYNTDDEISDSTLRFRFNKGIEE